MSGKQSGLVWDHVISGNARLVLLALAEAAEHDGSECRPSLGRIEWMTGLGRSTVRRHMRELIRARVLELVKAPRQHRPAVYQLQVARLPRKAPFVPRTRGVKTDPLLPTSDQTPDASPSEARGVNADRRGTTLAIPDSSSYPSDDSSESVISRWIEVRRGLPRYRFTDAPAIRTLREGIRAALASRVPVTVIRAAIEEAARRPFANPRGVDDGVREWIAVAVDRHERENRDRQAAEDRERRDRERDAASEASWQVLERRHGRSRSELAAMVIRGELQVDDDLLRVAS